MSNDNTLLPQFSAPDARSHEIQTNLSKMLRDPLPTRSALFHSTPEGDTVCLAEQRQRVAYLDTYMDARWAIIAHGVDDDVLAQQLSGDYKRFIPFAHLLRDHVVFHSWYKVRAAIVREWQVDTDKYDVWLECDWDHDPRAFLVSSHEQWTQQLRTLLLLERPEKQRFRVVIVPAQPKKPATKAPKSKVQSPKTNGTRNPNGDKSRVQVPQFDASQGCLCAVPENQHKDEGSIMERLTREFNPSLLRTLDQGQEIDVIDGNSPHAASEEGSFVEVDEHSESAFSLKPSEEYDEQPKGQLSKNVPIQYEKQTLDHILQAHLRTAVSEMTDDTRNFVLQLDAEDKLDAYITNHVPYFAGLVSG